VKVTLVPEQTLPLGLAAIVTLGVTLAVTDSVREVLVALFTV
jgi:hypothetical protein